MPRGSASLTAERRNEIIDACERLYQTMNFKDITIIEIGKATSFTRTSIYNYFKTKEEIFLALLQREYELWIEELDKISVRENLSKAEFTDELAKSLANRKQLLKLMSMNHFDMEANSRPENLVEFKRAYGNSLKAVGRCLDRCCSDWTAREKENFLYAFFPFVYGIYPYAVVTEEQRSAMETADVNFVYHSVYELAHNCIMKLL